MAVPLSSTALPGTCLRPNSFNPSPEISSLAIDLVPTSHISVQVEAANKAILQDRQQDTLDRFAAKLDPLLAGLLQLEPLTTSVRRIEEKVKPLTIAMKQIAQIEENLRPLNTSVKRIEAAVEPMQRIEVAVDNLRVKQPDINKRNDNGGQISLKSASQLQSGSADYLERKAELNLGDISCTVCAKCAELPNTKLMRSFGTADKSVNVPDEFASIAALDALRSDDWLRFPQKEGTGDSNYPTYTSELRRSTSENNLDYVTGQASTESNHESGMTKTSTQSSEEDFPPVRRRLQTIKSTFHSGADYREASATELVQDMLMKQDMRDMEDDSATHHRHGFSITRFILQKLLIPAAWYDDLVEHEPDGRIARMLDSYAFEMCSMTIIVVNSVFVAMSADWAMKHIGEDPPRYFVTCEYAFMVFYVIELSLKLFVHRFFFFFNSEMKWNWLDFVLVLVSSIDTFVLEVIQGGNKAGGSGNNVTFIRILRLMKIAKIFRAFRAMKAIKELVMIMESLRQSMMALFWVFIMLTFMLCVFALVFLQGMADYMAFESATLSHEQTASIMRHFGSMPQTMLTLYMCVTGGDDWGIYYRIAEDVGVFYAATFLFYTFFFTFALFNMLTAIFVEKTVTVATPDRAELAIQERRRQRRDAAEFKHVCQILDKDGTGNVTLQEFQENMDDETMISYLASVGLQIHDIETFFHMLSGTSEENVEISLDTFVHECMVLKGHATAIGMQEQLYEMHTLKKYLHGFVKDCHKKFRSLEDTTAKQISSVQSCLDRYFNQHSRRMELFMSQLSGGGYVTTSTL